MSRTLDRWSGRWFGRWWGLVQQAERTAWECITAITLGPPIMVSLLTPLVVLLSTVEFLVSDEICVTELTTPEFVVEAQEQITATTLTTPDPATEVVEIETTIKQC